MNISDIEVRTAGLDIGNVRKKEILTFCEKQGIKADDNYYSKKITNAHLYDYIVFLNIQMDKEMFTLCKSLYYDEIKLDDEKQITEICQNIQQAITKAEP